MLLILDLDETLVFASTRRLDRPPDFEVGEYFVYCRPGLEEFLKYATREFQTAVWSSSGSEYARQVVERIFPEPSSLQFIWTIERCTKRLDPDTRMYHYVKDLKKVKKLGHDLEQILIIDDSPEKVERNYGNHIRINPYEGNLDDNELTLLTRYLDRLKSLAQVRNVEKRNWREQAAHGSGQT